MRNEMSTRLISESRELGDDALQTVSGGVCVAGPTGAGKVVHSFKFLPP
jgi:hypothetical protein